MRDYVSGGLAFVTLALFIFAMLYGSFAIVGLL
jgi:hypothetical protein